MEQLKPEQPTTNYKMFVDAKLRECGRALNVPFGKMAGDHSLYNYSSGRMDDGPYWDDRATSSGRGSKPKSRRPLLYKLARLRQVRDSEARGLRGPVVEAQTLLALQGPAGHGPGEGRDRRRTEFDQRE